MAWTCNRCGNRTGVILYYAEVKPRGYRPRMDGMVLCRKCDKGIMWKEAGKEEEAQKR